MSRPVHLDGRAWRAVPTECRSFGCNTLAARVWRGTSVVRVQRPTGQSKRSKSYE